MLLMHSDRRPLSGFVTSSICFVFLCPLLYGELLSKVIDSKPDRGRDANSSSLLACFMPFLSKYF